MTERVDWGPIGEEGRRAFALFKTLATTYPNENPKWRVGSSAHLGTNTVINMQYFDTDQALHGEARYQAMSVTVTINGYGSSGFLTMLGNEAWEFEKLEEVATRASADLTDLLTRSGLHPIGSVSRQEARKSGWFSEWKLYPANHPIIQDLQKRRERTIDQ